MVALRKLDKKAKLPATVFTYTFGIIVALIADVEPIMEGYKTNAIQLSIISVVFCHREPLFFMPKNFKNITKNS